MNLLARKIFFCAVFLCCPWLSAAPAAAQTVSFNYYYKLNMAGANEPPQIGGVDVDFPDAARKNGVEGTLKASLTLGENGKTRDILIKEGLPGGVSEAVTKALQNLYFQPARRDGRPVAVTMDFDFVVANAYDESDKNVTKPKIIERPEPVYPASRLAEKLKGKVYVKVMCYADGRLQLLGVSSVLPKEFDRAATEAAGKVKFQPAVHKKSKKAVSQEMIIEYDFKP